jgi:hypothetical protein
MKLLTDKYGHELCDYINYTLVSKLNAQGDPQTDAIFQNHLWTRLHPLIFRNLETDLESNILRKIYSNVYET